MQVDFKTILMLAGLLINLVAVLAALIKVGKWQGATDTRIKTLENWRLAHQAESSDAWTSHRAENARAFDRFDNRINALTRRVYGDEDSEAIFITRREFEQFRDTVTRSHKELRESLAKHFGGVNDLIKTYFDRAEKERLELRREVEKCRQ